MRPAAHSIHLPAFDGIIYYTVDETSYRIVAILASGPEELPIRFISTLGPGQRIVISVPQSIGLPPIDFEVLRNGDGLVVSDPDGQFHGRSSDPIGRRPMTASANLHFKWKVKVGR
ncbi:hypothetical protein PYH37_001004 [Sinorhizobium numidicum]|uniref:Uncharacterized protein n=1 Tax=Sinorhizobium numidicum TaxID=680248 RepID=A0ABY8CSF7_9HYPH|nr:hypothetical protein [Sinorhizobium numidicum]WEX75572.1 hypothetical protein PYH37_001004 [Sinorhizobium numidicum]WEX81569.1 hypothetical protein PYH38_001005 [Sinorhizobium numidicum]